MPAKIFTTAESRLIEIWDYTLKKWGEDQADAYVRGLVGAIHARDANRSLGGVLPTRRDCGLSGTSLITFSSGSFLVEWSASSLSSTKAWIFPRGSRRLVPFHNLARRERAPCRMPVKIGRFVASLFFLLLRFSLGKTGLQDLLGLTVLR